MTRTEFIARLRSGLVGLPTTTAQDIVADYETHFADGIAAGRSEAEVAEALGNPGRLARELKAEAGIKRWHQEKNPSSAMAAIFAVLGLGAIDILILLPILMGVVGTIFSFFVAAIVAFFIGGAVLVAGPFTAFPGGAIAALLMGLGLMAAAVFVGALLMVVTILLVNGLVWYARLHYRLLKPALEAQSSTSPSEASV